MSVTSRWTGPEPATLLPRIDQMISAALTGTMGTFAAAAGVVYSGTRFAQSFAVQPTPIFREAALFNHDDLFAYVEEPTRAHEIRAHGRALRWIGPGGTPRFAVRVWHPGTHGKRLLNPLFEAASADLGARLARGWETLRVE